MGSLCIALLAIPPLSPIYIYADIWEMEVTVLTSNPTNFNRITQLLKVVVIQYICVEAPNLK